MLVKQKEAPVKKTKVERDKRTLVSQSSPIRLGEIEAPYLRYAPDGIGESWRKGLSADFGKPYFTQVSKFVTELHELRINNNNL